VAGFVAEATGSAMIPNEFESPITSNAVMNESKGRRSLKTLLWFEKCDCNLSSNSWGIEILAIGLGRNGGSTNRRRDASNKQSLYQYAK
jgi:hypothetical protein